jgi:SAM-dependent methyltransferase
MLRQIEPEILDRLDAADPRAVESRRDLQTIHGLMGIPGALAGALRTMTPGARLVDLGSGDGTLLLRVAERLGAARMPARAVLVDRTPAMRDETRAAFDRLGWNIEFRPADVFDWLGRPDPEIADVTIASLFLHHFRERALGDLLRRVAGQTRRLVACEPRRSQTALVGASLLRLIGCNGVTQNDAKISVRAGFCDSELSAAWPGGPGWRLAERRSGPFLHIFDAVAVQTLTNEPRV